MSKPWKPEIVTPDWTRPSAYRRSGGAGKVVVVLPGAAAVGLGAAYLMQPHVDDSNSKPDAPIEWNAVQAVPTRALTPGEVEWEKRGVEEDRPSTLRQPSGQASSGRTDDPLIGATGRLYVIDGDTISIGGQRIRIIGFDAPETHPPRCLEEARLGLAATAKLKELLASGTVTMSGSGHDQYGRELRTVQVGGQDVGETMIAAGLAREYGSGRRPWC